jgi:aspartyl-tRNA(Asn)/glutamyl-tRNA(Gln) amidotransferase subunit A
MSLKKRAEDILKKIVEEDNGKNGINCVLHINPDFVKEAQEIDEKIEAGRAGILAGKIIGFKSNINVKGLIANSASKTLENYRSTYDATVVERIRKEDGLILGMLNMDEFACGSSGETSAFGPTKNPVNKTLIPGGSSSGSAAAVAAGFCDITLGSDTGGSIRNPSSHCGIVGLKPSYGSVSRYGLSDLSMSLDQVGPLAKNVEDVELMFEVISGKDKRDATTFDLTEIPEHKPQKTLTIGLSKEFEKLCSDKKIYEMMKKKVESLAKKKGYKVIEVPFKHVNLSVQAYYPLCYVEFFSATRKYDGRRYGFKIEDAAGPEVLRIILGGAEISQAEYEGLYYRNALKVKELIKEEFEHAFQKADFIISPTVPRLPHKIGEKISVEEMYAYDALTIPANFAEICAISIPMGEISKVPVGMQIMAPAFSEKSLFNLSKEFEDLS